MSQFRVFSQKIEIQLDQTPTRCNCTNKFKFFILCLFKREEGIQTLKNIFHFLEILANYCEVTLSIYFLQFEHDTVLLTFKCVFVPSILLFSFCPPQAPPPPPFSLPSISLQLLINPKVVETFLLRKFLPQSSNNFYLHFSAPSGDR